MDCVINPKTNRAVKKSSALGKRLIKNADKTLKEDCIINPKTGRAVRRDGALGRRILKAQQAKQEGKQAPKTPPPAPPPAPLKQSTKSFEEIEEEIIVPAPPKKDKTVSPQKSKPSTIFITQDAKADSNDKYSLDNRIMLYNKAKKYLDQISEKECIEKIKIGRKNIMTLSNKLFMDKRIGTESVYGAIYLSSVKNVNDLLVVSKIARKNTDNINEVLIMEKLTEKLVKTKKTKHFPLLYTSHLCPTKEKLGLVSVNELCNGDLKMLVNTPSVSSLTDRTIVNIIYQIFISLTTFNNFGYLHNDTHWGNFLYQNNNEKGYYKYQYKKKTFYIQACPYNIMLYDFGLSSKLKTPNEKICLMDFVRPMYALIPEKAKRGERVGWNEYIKERDLCEAVRIIIDEMITVFNNAQGNISVFDIILSALNRRFAGIYYEKLKPTDIILNDAPFIIA